MPIKVYNPKISSPNTYFVIIDYVPILVHNKNIGKGDILTSPRSSL